MPDGAFLRVTIEGGASPFRRVAYDISVRGNLVLLGLIKESPCIPGQRQSLKIVTGREAEGVIERLREAGAFDEDLPFEEIEGRDEVKEEAEYEIWSSFGNKMHRLRVQEKDLFEDKRLLKVVLAARREVVTRTEPIPARLSFFLPREIGYLSVTASEEATAVLDGIERMKVPIEALEVREGEHVLVVQGVSGRVRTLKVWVGRGLTRHYHVKFEE